MKEKISKIKTIIKKEKLLIYIIIKFLLLITFFYAPHFIISHIIKYEKYKIPELNKYNFQRLKFFIPSKKINAKCSKTIFFETNFTNSNISEKSIKTIILDKFHKNYFVTYNMINNAKFNNYHNILQNNGLIKSTLDFQNHNFIRNYIDNSLNKYQKRYLFFTASSFHHKDKLYMNYKNMQNLFGDEYNYMVETYIYPKDKNIIENKFQNYEFNLSNLWLIKPNDLRKGKGIFIFKTFKDIDYQTYIITKYIQNPDLINNKKYDLRLYILITGLRPLRIYFNKEGLVRFASENYKLNNNSINNAYIFLTNSAINKENSNYFLPKNDSDESASIWNLKTYKNYLIKKNVDYNLIRQKIKDIIIKSIISFHDKLYNDNQGYNFEDRNVFSILGFDILITDKYEPVLLEINNGPVFATSNLVDEKVKINYFFDSLNIVGIQPFSHEGKLKPLDKEYKFYNETEDLVNNAFCELNRPRGDFELIFPLKENIEKYKKYFVNNNLENIKLWEKINLN